MAATIIGMLIKTTKKNKIGFCACLAVYVLSEIISNFIRDSYLLDFLLMFVGTIALGGVTGFLIGVVVSKIKTKEQ